MWQEVQFLETDKSSCYNDFEPQLTANSSGVKMTRNKATW